MKKKPQHRRLRKVYYADGHVGYRPVLTRREYLKKLRGK